MAENLVIVESPAKARTIKKYLGKGFEVLASYGHVRDLVPKEGAVDPDDGFAMKYQLIERNERHVAAISKALGKADALYLATDPDREGEAIAWHLSEILRERGELKKKKVHRVVFHEITKNAIRAAVAAPRELSLDLVNAQQARRALDYLVGFNLSPLLWNVEEVTARSFGRARAEPGAAHDLRARGGDRRLRAAGILEHRFARRAFRAELSAQADRVSRPQGGTVQLPGRDQRLPRCAADADRGRRQGRRTARGGCRSQAAPPATPAPPFTTSTLQQEAFAQARLSRPSAPCGLAQQLYEGIDIWRGQRRPDHLHAHRFGIARSRSGQRDSRGDCAIVRAAGGGRGSARLQDQVEKCPGSARSHSPHIGSDRAGRYRALPPTPISSSSTR